MSRPLARRSWKDHYPPTLVKGSCFIPQQDHCFVLFQRKGPLTSTRRSCRPKQTAHGYSWTGGITFILCYCIYVVISDASSVTVSLGHGPSGYKLESQDWWVRSLCMESLVLRNQFVTYWIAVSIKPHIDSKNDTIPAVNLMLKTFQRACLFWKEMLEWWEDGNFWWREFQGSVVTRMNDRMWGRVRRKF